MNSSRIGSGRALSLTLELFYVLISRLNQREKSMKTFIKFALLAAVLASLCGCASEPYETRYAPPDAFRPVFLRFKEMPGQKVMVVAVDPTPLGVDREPNWAFGYDDSRATLEEAAENAAIKCDKARKKHKVFAKCKIFAVNDEVVYFKDQAASK
jgi:hypothetical protein